MKEKSSHKIKAERRGRWAEAVAALMLRLKGYQILYRRHTTPVGEVDIIAAHRKTLVIIEVKYRAILDDAKAAITHKQRERLIRAGDYMLANQSRYDHVRFDLIAIAPRRLPTHIIAAWRSGE